MIKILNEFYLVYMVMIRPSEIKKNHYMRNILLRIWNVSKRRSGFEMFLNLDQIKYYSWFYIQISNEFTNIVIYFIY